MSFSESPILAFTVRFAPEANANVMSTLPVARNPNSYVLSDADVLHISWRRTTTNDSPASRDNAGPSSPLGRSERHDETA